MYLIFATGLGSNSNLYSVFNICHLGNTQNIFNGENFPVHGSPRVKFIFVLWSVYRSQQVHLIRTTSYRVLFHCRQLLPIIGDCHSRLPKDRWFLPYLAQKEVVVKLLRLTLALRDKINCAYNRNFEGEGHESTVDGQTKTICTTLKCTLWWSTG